MPRAVDHFHVEEALETGTADAVLMLKSSSTDLDALPAATEKQHYKAAEDESGTSLANSLNFIWAKHRRLVILCVIVIGFCVVFFGGKRL
jgi:hypothetical protein